jgi:O-antigen/teichoic acid export membrane protein
MTNDEMELKRKECERRMKIYKKMINISIIIFLVIPIFIILLIYFYSIWMRSIEILKLAYKMLYILIPTGMGFIILSVRFSRLNRIAIISMWESERE